MPKLKWEQCGQIWEAEIRAESTMALSLVVFPSRIAVILDERHDRSICLSTRARTADEFDVVDAMKACEALAADIGKKLFGALL